MIQSIIALFRPAPRMVLEDRAAVTRDANRLMAQSGLDGLSPHDATETILAWLKAHHAELSDADEMKIYLAISDIHWPRVQI